MAIMRSFIKGFRKGWNDALAVARPEPGDVYSDVYTAEEGDDGELHGFQEFNPDHKE